MVQQSDVISQKAPYKTLDSRREIRQKITRKQTVMAKYKGLSRKNTSKKIIEKFQDFTETDVDMDIEDQKEEQSDKLIQFEQSLL